MFGYSQKMFGIHKSALKSVKVYPHLYHYSFKKAFEMAFKPTLKK